MKPQIIHIHGGDAFAVKEDLYAMLRRRPFDLYVPARLSWQKSLFANNAETHDCFRLEMPNSSWADYTAWSIWFEKIIPQLRDGVILIGHSLGGGFLLRYLTENKLPVKVGQLHLVSAVVDDNDCPGVGEFKIDVAHWSGFLSDIRAVHLWHSTDDWAVPIHHSERLHEKLPSAHLHLFNDRGHFLTETFPELEAVIKNE